MLDLKALHQKCYRHRAAVEVSEQCGCFGCLRIFAATEITEWVRRDADQTAVCPYCESDTVLPGSEVELTPELLAVMGHEWLGESPDSQEP